MHTDRGIDIERSFPETDGTNCPVTIPIKIGG